MTTLNPGLILSEVAPTMPGMHHPWRILRDQLPDWTVVLRPLALGRLGQTDARTQTIELDSRMLQTQRRCTLDHELIHAEAGDEGCQHPKREAWIAQESARRLIPLERLLAAVVWARNIPELADECWVDLDTLRCRLDHLHPSERAALKRALANRENEEPA